MEIHNEYSALKSHKMVSERRSVKKIIQVASYIAENISDVEYVLKTIIHEKDELQNKVDSTKEEETQKEKHLVKKGDELRNKGVKRTEQK